MRIGIELKASSVFKFDRHTIEDLLYDSFGEDLEKISVEYPHEYIFELDNIEINVSLTDECIVFSSTSRTPAKIKSQLKAFVDDLNHLKAKVFSK